jgi:hypothetical protein
MESRVPLLLAVLLLPACSEPNPEFCSSSADCAGHALCDRFASQCVESPPCDDHGECESGVCRAGICALENQVVRVDPAGADAPDCGSVTAPCRTLEHAVGELSDERDAIRLAPGVYTSGIALDRSAHFVGESEALIASPGPTVDNFVLRGSGTWSFDNIVFEKGTAAILCDSASGTLALDRVVARNHGDFALDTTCDTTVSRATIESSRGCLRLWSGGRLEIERSTIRGCDLGLRADDDFKLINSIVHHNQMAMSLSAAGEIAYSTIADNGSPSTPCSSSSAIHHNIIREPLLGSTGTVCDLRQNLLDGPGSDLVIAPDLGNIFDHASFENADAGNYRIDSRSPAVDAAAPSATHPDEDFDGTYRPQGTAADLGAYEVVLN